MLGGFTRIAVVSNCKTLQCGVEGIDGANILILECDGEGNCRVISSFTNPAVKAIRRKGKAAALTIVRYNVDAAIVSDIGPGAFEEFKARNIKVFIVNEGTMVEEAVQHVVSGKISEAVRPTHERGHGKHRDTSINLR
ncbi:MAG: hypothetical protein DRO23_08035 [Thermoprotei archaeon]|nr:MAG: hypothetical protein DRO23_08035 [Thermoprotei archaeon]